MVTFVSEKCALTELYGTKDDIRIGEGGAGDNPLKEILNFHRLLKNDVA